ncbi:GNAT family N-acetyltransferase [uncultured Thiodictyon sp.]|uniref:GNAT family N-acetyltransferase n=1 Tax=uncultured Thiodictyon sp. TaxID=1846217 RepID=UPI0025EF31A9|nr:GNAT family N-acetyltransferase [uncultured Thiodictyon sp.]
MTDQSAIRFESKPLRGIGRSESQRLRELTTGDRQSHMLAVLREHPEYAQCFLAWDGDEIVGWSLARWFAPFVEGPRNAHVSVFVDPAWRRLGLGRQLLGQAVEFAVAHRLRPWVSAGAPDQSAFFRACASGAGIVGTPFRLR